MEVPKSGFVTLETGHVGKDGLKQWGQRSHYTKFRDILQQQQSTETNTSTLLGAQAWFSGHRRLAGGMEDPTPDDWLPPGWTVEVRVRKNGKRDKYYFPPSSGLKFNSKVEVFRHLDNARNKVSIQKISPNVLEKGIAEGLPPGWTKKTRITTKGDTVRRDLVLMKIVLPFVVSLQAIYCMNDSVIRTSELYIEYYIDPSASVTKTLSVSMSQSSDLDMIDNSQQIPRPASSGEYTPPILECISSVAAAEKRKVELAQGTLVSDCPDRDAQERQVQENLETKHGTEHAPAQNRQRKSKHKKEINLPRRASKRLAGIKVDPVPELITRNRARRVAVKQSGEETVTNGDKSPNSLSDGLSRQYNALEDGSEIKCNSEKHPDKPLEVLGSDNDNECFSFLPQENNASVQECVRILENGDKVDAKLAYTLDFPLREILTDPCIAFAIQTLTGVTFDTTNSHTSELRTSQQHSETSAAKGHSKKNNGSSDNVFSSQENSTIPQEHAGDAKANDDKANNENAGASSENTLDMSWMDPCIEFAIKTLTGTIPIDSSDQNHKNCLQQQLSSSSNQHSDMALPSVSLDNLYQTDYYCSQQYLDPSLQHTRNIGIGNSAGGARLPHCGEDNRRNVC
ncbi:hypothetical protein VNO77_33553 [Canavalia gladiata]|uniref:MBD domain-containing protein n=1 Tax=Canavalia gladiata TaxID=3824 RepID=A0AAN9PXU2_CANGL